MFTDRSNNSLVIGIIALHAYFRYRNVLLQVHIVYFFIGLKH